MDIILIVLLIFSGVSLIPLTVLKFEREIEQRHYMTGIFIFVFILSLLVSTFNYRKVKLQSLQYRVNQITVVNSEENIFQVTAIKDPGAWLTNDSTIFYTTKHYDFGQEIAIR